MKIPLYLFTLFFFWCCVSKNDRQAMTDISGMREVVFDDKNTINIDSVIANYRFVRLDSTDNFPIGELWQTLITDDHIILVDKLHSKSVFIFDKTGKNKAITHRQGRGPQEYISLFHVTLTPDRQKIAIVDDLGKKVVFFRPGWKFHRKQKDSDNVFDARICLGRQSGRRNIQRESGRSRIARFQAYRQSNFIYGS